MRFNSITKDFYLGENTYQCYKGYSTDGNIRKNCASGGIVSAILVEMLKKGIINGAVVSKIECSNGTISGFSQISTSADDIIKCGSSIYFEVKPFKILDKIRSFQGKLAFVGLPCHISYLDKILDKDRNLKDKIIFKIGLFCGHNSKKELLIRLLKRKKIPIEHIQRFVFRKGLWRGQTHVFMKNNTGIVFPFKDFSLYQNLHFFSQKKCLYCDDHTAEKADISCGDIWLSKMKKHNIKHTLFITRSSSADQIIQEFKQNKSINVEKITFLEVFLAQRRSIIYHKSLYVRSLILKIFGKKIHFSKKNKIRFYDYISNFIVVFNVTLSEKQWFKRMVFYIPRPILYIYLLLFKGLTHF